MRLRILVTAVLFVCVLGLGIGILVAIFYGKKQQNTTTPQLSGSIQSQSFHDSSRHQGLYRLTYNADEGLMTELSDGSKKENLYPGPILNIYQLESPTRLLMITTTAIGLFDTTKKQFQSVFTYTDGNGKP